MRMLIVFFSLIFSVILYEDKELQTGDQAFLIFSNDGTFYKLDPDQQHVHWHSDLRQKLISFQIQQSKLEDKNVQSTYFIPTIQGNFVYIERNKQILVHRQQIQQLIKMCFGKSSFENTVSQNGKQRYFLHQKYQYFILDFHNGKIWNIQQFFEEKIVVKPKRYALIKISKKYLKQLNNQFQIKWSVVSSTIDIIDALQFLSDPKKPVLSQDLQNANYQLRRTSNNQIQIKNINNSKSFQIGGKSPILSVFNYKRNQRIFQKYPIKYYQKPLLALNFKNQKKQIGKKYNIEKNQVDSFPHSSQFKNSNQINLKFSQKQENKQFNFQYCLNTYRAFQQLGTYEQNSNLQIPKKEINNVYLPSTQTFSHFSIPNIHHEPQRSRDQPLIWIFIVVSLTITGVFFYKLKVNKLLNQLQKMQTNNDKKFQQIQKKLGQFQQMQKMYQVYWDKLIYRKNRRKCSDDFFEQPNTQNLQNKGKMNHQIEVYEHLIFEGRFLNKQALVYAVPIQSIDLIHVEHQLNDLLSCSHKSLIKLYYYTKNSQFLLIFCQKIDPFWISMQKNVFDKKQVRLQLNKINQNIEDTNGTTIQQAIQSHQQNKVKNKLKKSEKLQQYRSQNIIKEIIQSVRYLDSHLQIFSLPLQSIILHNRNTLITQKQQNQSLLNTFVEVKLNAIPIILQVYKYDIDCQQDTIKARNNQNKKLRHDLVRVFYYLISKGQNINFKQIKSSILTQQTKQQEFFVKDFYDFVLNENYNFNIEILNNQQQQKKEKGLARKIALHNQLLKQLLFHPFLWDSKRKMLFLSDFSNYIETYLDDYKVKKLQLYAKDFQIIDNPWTKYLDAQFVKQVSMFRKYDFYSVKDLIRLIRNKVNHFHEIPKQIRNSVGKTPEAFIQYMLSLYPKLLSFAFVYAKRKKWKLHVQIQ